MNRADLVEALSQQTGLSVAQADEVMRIIFGLMAESLVSGERVEIRGFGSFSIKEYDGYEGRNPRTGEIVEVKPKRLPHFKCGK